MVSTLQALRKKFVVGFVGGSDFKKISEQLAPDGHDGEWWGHVHLIDELLFSHPSL